MRKNRIVQLVFVWILFITPLFFVDPTKLPIGVLLLPLALLGVAVFITVRVLLEKKAQNHRTAHRIAAMIGISVVLIVALLSLNQFTLRDALVGILLILLGFFYVGRTISKK